MLAIIFLVTCLYHLFYDVRCNNELSDNLNSIALVEKNLVTSVPVSSLTQTAATPLINKPDKEIKISICTEKTLTSTTAGDFVGLSVNDNGNTGSAGTNMLLVNANTDPSELRLLQHEHC